MKKTIFLAAAAMLIMPVLFAAQDDRILVKVNDEVILQSEVDEAVEAGAELFKQSGKAFNEADFRKKTLQDMVDQKIIITMAKDENVAVSDEAVADKVNEYLEGLRARYPNEEAFEAALQKAGLSYTDFRIKIEAQVRDSLVFSKVKQKKQQELIGKTAVSDGEIAAYYDKNKDAFKVNDQMKLLNITFTNGAVETPDLAKYAADIAARIKAGETFEKISAELNGKKGIATADLDWIDTSSMAKNIREALRNPKKGKVVGPIENTPGGAGEPGGYQLIKISDYKSGLVPKLDDIKEKVRVRIIEEKVEKMWTEWIEKVKKEAYVKYM